MTKQDWQRVKERWFYTLAFKFEVDGYQLTLEHSVTKTGQVEYGIYVNGWLKGEWANHDCEERRRFMRKVTHRLHTLKEAKKWKHMCKRAKIPYENKTWESYTPFWRNFASFKRHLTANNQEIRLVYPEDAQTSMSGLKTEAGSSQLS